jgi:hypothetical protein
VGGLVDYPPHFITDRELAGALSRKIWSIEFQTQKLTTPVRAIGRPRLLTPEADEMMTKLATDGFRRREPIRRR